MFEEKKKEQESAPFVIKLIYATDYSFLNLLFFIFLIYMYFL